MSPAQNQLGGESSAYLRAHANDPVAWRPWSAKTLAEARKLGKPVFLSIGYQSCHWCHVMQRESFRDIDTAKTLNGGFVPVKVDREMRPDLDALYMSYVQASTGSGGWPMSVFLTPDGLPLFGGTYFPYQGRGEAMPSFRQVMSAVHHSWKISRDDTMQIAQEALDFLREQQIGARMSITREMLDEAADALLSAEDPQHGGFGGAPKFPQAPLIAFLVEYSHLTGDDRPAHAALRAVLAMLRGGVFDQAGGGLFRYSVDAQWLVPHFEKMLYDQGLLLTSLASLEPFADPVVRDELAFCARATAGFLERDLGRSEGGFYSSLDAETGGVEGDTYVWTLEELAQLLSPDELALAEEFLGVTPEGNWERATTILTRRAGRGAEAERSPAVDAVLHAIAEARAARPQPAVIDNVIVSWNALAARGLLHAGAAFGDPTLVEAGLAGTRWLADETLSRSGDVLHAIGNRSLAGIRFLEDYSAVAAALIEAGRLGAMPGAEKLAHKVHDAALKRFRTPQGLAMSEGDPALPLTVIDTDDTPTPSGAAMLAENALALQASGGGTVGPAVAADALAQCGRTARVAPALAGYALAVQARLDRLRD